MSAVSVTIEQVQALLREACETIVELRASSPGGHATSRQQAANRRADSVLVECGYKLRSHLYAAIPPAWANNPPPWIPQRCAEHACTKHLECRQVTARCGCLECEAALTRGP